MPEQETIERAQEDEREGKSPSTQAGEFVREEMEHIREGKHGARSTKQAIAIGLSKARRAGVKLPPWIVQGTTSRSQTSATEKRVGQDEETGSARFTERENCAAAQAVADAFARGQEGPQTRIEPGRIAPGTIASGAFRRPATHESESFSSSKKGRAHPQTKTLS